MTDLGLMRYFLGMQVRQEPGRIFISREKCAADLLKKFNMSQSKPVSTPFTVNEKLSKNGGEKKIDETVSRKLFGSLVFLYTQDLILIMLLA
jgi:hypothetical protein